MLDDYPWGSAGQELLEHPQQRHEWDRIVACLNVWNDIDDLKATWNSWSPYVDAVIAVDGEYGTGRSSDDGTLEFLGNFPHTTVVHSDPRAPWPDQPAKRNEYFADDLCRPGDLLFVIDADEHVANGEAIRTVPYCDVAWATVTSPLYDRPQHQPRFVRWRPGLHYAGRHHWLMCEERQLCTHQQGGAGFDHRLSAVWFHNSRGGLRTDARRAVVDVARQEQLAQEFKVGNRVVGHEPLRILQVGPFDPGNVVYRLHTAINTTTPHESAMATGDLGPYNPPRQFDFATDRLHLRDLAVTADVIHHHVMQVADKYLDVELAGRPTVMHHHGTELRRDPFTLNARDRERRIAVRLVSNLELLQYDEGLEYLPNPVPVARYRRLGLLISPKDAGRLRVAHSPSKKALKATDVFLRVCKRLERLVEPVLIHDVPLAQALMTKSACAVCFDSFFLGMQCSGIEAAAMGMPVVAGDLDCKREYEARFGGVPYTFANDEAALTVALERLATDGDYYRDQKSRIGAFVETNHDYAAVSRQYLAILDRSMRWREGLRLGNRLPLARAPTSKGGET